MSFIVSGRGTGNVNTRKMLGIGRRGGRSATVERRLQRELWQIFRHAVLHFHRVGLHGKIGRFHSFGVGRQTDFAGIHRGAHQHPVHSAFHRQAVSPHVIVGNILCGGSIQQSVGTVIVGLLHLLVVARGQTAYPAPITPHAEMNHAVVERTAAALLVEYLHLEKHHVGTVGLRYFGILDSGQFQLSGGTSGFQLIPAAVRPYGQQCAGLEVHLFERVQIVIAACAFAQRFPVQEEFHLVGRGNHIDGFLGASFVVPVSDDIGLLRLIIHPSVPHHLMDEEGIFGNAHRIGDATHAEVGLAPMMRVGIREHNLHAAAADAGSRAGTLHPIVVPAAHHFHGKCVHIVVVVGGRLAAIERTVALLVIGIRIFVPVFAQSLVATIFHGPHGMLLRLVDIQHLAAIFRLVDVKHLTRADGPAAIGIVLVAQRLHLEHVLTADALVATLVEQDAGIVTVVDDGIAHQVLALLPPRSFNVLLGITGGHGLNQSDTVARLDVLLPGCDVHPSDQIAVRLHHQSVGIVAEPGRNGKSHARPLVRSALRIAMHHQHAVVQPYLSLGESCLAETGAGNDLIVLCVKVHRTGIGTVLGQIGLDGVEITIAPRPEVHSLEFSMHGDVSGFAGLQRHALAGNDGRHVVVGVQHLGKKAERTLATVLVAHLTLYMHHG